MNPAERRAGFDPRSIAPDPDALAGRVIAITGPTAGIGRALAFECARRGAELILLGRSVRKLEALDAELASLTQHGGAPVLPAVLAPLDLEKALAGDYDAVAEAIERRWGRLYVLWHNACFHCQLAPL